MEKFYVAALQMVSGIGSSTIKYLSEYFGSAQQAWQAGRRDLFLCGKLSEDVIDKLTVFRLNFSVEQLAERLHHLKIDIILLIDPQYPSLLKRIYQPPAALYYRGLLPDTDKLIGMVGSRNATEYGKNCAIMLAQELTAAKVTIVSGGAKGIDTAAHIGALKIGSTIAVLGNGIDVVYPPQNRLLFERIVEQGAVLSEYPPGTLPKPFMFPARNRLISGLTRGIIVVEAAEKSGALITADFALEESRDVFCVPGSIFAKLSRGTNALIQQGGKLICSAQDVLDEYNWQVAHKINVISLSAEEKTIFDLLQCDIAVNIEIIIQKTGFTAATVASILLQLELRDYVRNVGGNNYLCIVREEIR